MFFYGLPQNYFQPEFTFQPCAIFFAMNEGPERKNQTSFENSGQADQQQKTIPVHVMMKELEKRHKKSKSRFWSEEEDSLLIKLAQEETNWEKIAKSFKAKDFHICKRRYQRLIKQNQKWPKENEELIKHLFQVQKLSWLQIKKILPMYTKKQIKERYKNFLQVQIKRAEWTVEQDLKLWQEVKKHGNKWVNFTKLFEGRSQLQLKNRYNKLIKPLEESLLGLTNANEEENCSDESWHLNN